MGYYSLGALAPLTEPGQCKEGANSCKHWKAYAQSSYQGVFVLLTIGVVTVPLGMIALNVRAPTVL